MPETLQVGTLSVARGEKAMGWQRVPVPDHSVEIPIFAVSGTRPGPTLVVTAGVHGAEYASIEAALRLGRTTQPADLRGRLIVAPIVNMPAFRARSIYVCPLDGKNLNRIFPGNPEGSAGERIAYWVFENVIRQGDYFVDLHGGDMIEDLKPFANYYGSPVPGYRAPEDTVEAALGVTRVLARIFADAHPPGAPPPGGVPPAPPGMAGAVRPLVDELLPGRPPEVAVAAVVAWTQLLGMVGLELFGHFVGATGDIDAVFAYAMRTVAAVTGIG